MATLVLGLAGKALLGPVGGMIGSLAGRFIDNMLFGQTQKVEGPRLKDLNFQASTEGSAIPRLWGKMRVSPQVIWATRFKETKTTKKSGGKGSKPKVKTTTYSYSVSFACGLVEGEITGIGRVWADGKLLKLRDYTYRLYLGSETQGVDPKILAVEGADNAPAFRGTAYIVFEDMELEPFGNRVPQMTFEVFRRADSGLPTLEELMRAVTMIPGATEFGYATTQVSVEKGFGDTEPDNSNASGDVTDLIVSLDELQAQAPEVTSVTLVVAWHGTDLRCGNCEIRPKVEDATRSTKPFSWQVGPVTRGSALVVSQYDGKPAAGGAPADRAVYEAIKELINRGLKVTLYPFILMDIPSGNALPDPYGGAEQAAYPWRGRITCHPAPGQPGTVDKTATAATQVASFFGTALASHFSWNSGGLTVSYSGPSEWGLRRQVLHLAQIAKAAGGIDQIIIGSELVGLTTVRSTPSTYPAAAELVSLAAQVRSIVGSATRIGYAADWSEYHSHRPADGSNDVYFHLDPVWSDSNIDFVGIDNYLPLADWRDGTSHLDAQAGYSSIYNRDYLQANIEGGEYYDWYYASQADRDNQVRTAITDGAHAKPWVFRNKDIRNWWLNSHYDRPGGTESATATAWSPQSKPIVFTELGCPAVDKGANQPNVFVDPKSSESARPHYSQGRRDDAMQRALLEAVLQYWQPASGNNPTSSVYSAPMIDWERIALWTWDARPYPEFPNFTDLWADAPNWDLGHWLDGRLNLVRLSDVVEDIASGFGIPLDVSRLEGLVYGYLVDQVSTARDELAPLQKAYFFDAAESQGRIMFKHRGTATAVSYHKDELIRDGDGKSDGNRSAGAFTLTRAQESELPRGVNLAFAAPDADYRQVTAQSRRLIGAFQAIQQVSLALALPDGRASAIAGTMLMQAHIERERAVFVLPPSALALDAADVIELDTGGRSIRLRMDEIGMGAGRNVTAVREYSNIYDQNDGPGVAKATSRTIAPAPPVVYFLDLPVITDAGAALAHAPKVAAYGSPWSPVAVYRAADENASLELDTLLESPAILGRTKTAFSLGPLWRFDRANTVQVEIGSTDTLASVSELDLLNGANLGAVQTAGGRWEIFQWRMASLVAANTYELSMLLRGQLGTEADMAALVAAGAPFVVLDSSVLSTSLPSALSRSPQYWSWGPDGRAVTDALYVSDTKTFEAIGLRPYAPAHFKGKRNTGGDVTLNWVRRTRYGGDDWELNEIPLSEDAEAYEIDILNGANVVRTISTAVTTALYSAAEQTADFGSVPASFDAIVYQLSATYGRGAGTRRTI
jgi:hypothetical protein